MDVPDFEWDEAKDAANRDKHGVSFVDAQYAFLDRQRVIARNKAHGGGEKRYYCFGTDREGAGVLTVRFTYRSG